MLKDQKDDIFPKDVIFILMIKMLSFILIKKPDRPACPRPVGRAGRQAGDQSGGLAGCLGPVRLKDD